MKEFIEKLIGRLEEIKTYYAEDFSQGYSCEVDCVEKYEVKKIVNQLAEEYNNDMVTQLAMMYAKNLYVYGIDVTKAWETATSQSMALEQAYLRGRQYERDRFAEWQEEHNNGWIPCSERLPDKRDWYLVVFREGDSDFVLVPRVADYIGKENVCTTNEGWLIIDMADEIGINAYYKNLKCIAWQPLPAPYKEGE